MLYYKNIIDGELAGLTESPYELNIENFFEVTKEEYIQLGGYVTPDPVTESVDQEPDSFTEAIISALLD